MFSLHRNFSTEFILKNEFLRHLFYESRIMPNTIWKYISLKALFALYEICAIMSFYFDECEPLNFSGQRIFFKWVTFDPLGSTFQMDSKEIRLNSKHASILSTSFKRLYIQNIGKSSNNVLYASVRFDNGCSDDNDTWFLFPISTWTVYVCVSISLLPGRLFLFVFIILFPILQTTTSTFLLVISFPEYYYYCSYK